VEDRWLRLIGSGVVSLGLLAALGATVSAAGGGPPACDGGVMIRAVPAAAATPADGLAAPAPPFDLEPVLDPAGALTGQRLMVPDPRGGGSRALDLPPESFATGPFGGVVLVGADDGSVTRVRAWDVATGCLRDVARSTDVIRTAALSPDGATVFETRVDRRSRADLGVWRRPAALTTPAVRVLGPPDADPRFGRTWATSLAWSVDGDHLAIQSCGEIACRTRVLDPSSGAVSTVDDPDLGVMVGLAGDRLVTYGACRGFPCRLVSIDVTDGRRTILADASGPARLAGRGAATRVVHEWRDPTGTARRRSVDPAGRLVVDLGPVPEPRKVDEVSR